MRRFLLATTACLALGGLAGPARAQTTVDVEMAIVFDTSSSVQGGVFDRSLDAHIALFNDPRLMPFLRQQGIQSLAVSAFSFGSFTEFNATVRQATSWQIIRTATDARAFAAALNAGRTYANISGISPIGAGILWPATGPNDPRFQAQGMTPTGLLNNGITATRASGPRVILNIVTDGEDDPTDSPPISPRNGALAARNAGVNVINALSTRPETGDFAVSAFARGKLLDMTQRDLGDVTDPAFRTPGFIEFPLSDTEDFFQAACRKFARELSLGTPAAGASCDALLASGTPTIITVIQPGTTRTNSTIRQVVLVRVARVTDVAIPPATNTLSTTTETGRQTTLTLVSEVTDTVANTTTRTWREDTTISEVVDLRIEDLIPLRMPLEYGAVTRLGAALFGEMLENQPQRAQRLRGQVATRGPAAVRGDGAPSAAARPEGGIFAAAGLNDSLRYTATGQFAALPGFDFGWGEAPAGLDPAFTGSTGIWGRPFYSQARLSGGRGVDSYDHTHRGFALGADLRIGRYGLVGVWGGGSSANVGFAGPGGGGPSSASMTSWVGGVYGSAATGNPDTGLWYADVTLGYGEQDWTLNRTTLAGAPARGEFRSPALGAYTEAGFAGQWGQMLWQPHLFLRTVQTERPGLAETGTDEGVARQVDGARFTSLQAGPGLRASRVISLGDGLSLVPEGRIRWEHEYGDNAAAVSGAFVFDGSRVPFAGRAPGLDRDALGLGASLRLARLTGGPAGGGFGLDLDWDASVSNDTTAHRLALQMRLAW